MADLAALRHKIIHGSGIWEIVRFGIVGGLATAVDLCVTLALVLGFDLGRHENIVTSAAFSTAFVVSYFGHRFFTFQKDGSAAAFLLVALGTLGLRNLMVWGMVQAGMRGLPPLIIAMAAVTVITYVVSKFEVFKGKSNSKTHS
ncbi:MAG: GtrA family protein [Succinivibrio sp.]|jgi:putative flippase GtrA|nr:GtrA family protein [Succinivibrio sp.]